MRYTSLTVIFTYFCVFVLHPVFGLASVVASLIPGRLLAAESEAVYEQMVSKYGVNQTDNDVAAENKLSEIKSKYGKGSSTGNDVTQGLTRYQTDDAGATLDMSNYQNSVSGADFTQRYQSAYGEVSGGGMGLGKAQMPGVSGGNVSVNYAGEGGSAVSRNADGSVSSSALNNETTHTTPKEQLVGSEADHPETSFSGNSDYNPSSDDSLVTNVKNQIAKAGSGNTSDSVAYRTITDTYQNNRPTNISRDNVIFDGSKAAVSSALAPGSSLLGSCTTSTTTEVIDKHYPSWSEHRCSAPNKSNTQSCQIKRTAEFPIKVISTEGDVKEHSIDYIAADTLRIRVGRSGDWLMDARDDGFSKLNCKVYQSKIKFQIDSDIHVLSAVRTSVAFDDVLRIFLNGQLIGHGEDNFDGSQWASIPASSKIFPDSFFAGMPLDSKMGHDNGLPITTCERNDHSIGSDLDVTDIAKSYQGGNILEMGYILGVGGAGGAMYDLTIKFDKPVSPKITNEQIPAGCADAIGWHQDDNPSSCVGSTDVGCSSPIKVPGGICQATQWVSTSTSTGGLSSSMLALIPPLFPGDSGNKTWSANANGYFCDPLEKSKLCVDKAGEDCYSFADIQALPDGCAKYASDPTCYESSRECVEGWKDTVTGVCYMEDVAYQCDEGKTVSQIVKNTSNSCGTMPCIGTDCSAGEPETNDSFGQTAGLLNAVSFMSADGECDFDDPTKCKVFKGEETYCGWAVGAVGSIADTNCCESPDTGPGLVSASMTAYSVISKMNWQTIAGEAVETTGSTSWYDIYYTADGYLSTASKAYNVATNAISNAANSVINSFAGEATSATGSQVAQEGIMNGFMEAAKQKVYEGMYSMLGGAEGIGGSIFQQEGASLVLTDSAQMIVGCLNVVMIAYMVYKITVMIAQMIVACEQKEIETAVKIHEKSCFKVGSTYCMKKALGACAKRGQKYCCYSSMLPRIVMQQAVKQLNLDDCSGITVAQLQQLDWRKIDLSEWVAEATLGGMLPDGSDDLTLEALTGSGHAYANGEDRDTTLEKLEGRFESDNLVEASESAQDLISLETVDCSYLPRPAICKFQ